MKLSALLTSAGINIALCVVLLLLYSVLRRQPGNVNVYFGRRLAEEHRRRQDSSALDRLVPSPSWILKAWEYTESDILSIAGLDAVVFLRIVVFSIRIFSIAAAICIFGVLPLNYFGQEMRHRNIPSESLDVFTIANVMQGSKWLWVHCLALYIISVSACILLYFEYKTIAKLRLAYITGSAPNPSHFSVLVRAIPSSTGEPFSDSVRSFFTKYHSLDYLSHQMIYRTGKVQKLLNNAEAVYKKVVNMKDITIQKGCVPHRLRCGLCGGPSGSFQLYHNELDLEMKNSSLNDIDPCIKEKECAAAFVFFRTRYAAIVASKVLQTSNPMIWVTDLAPEPVDVYWSNLWLPYRQLWIRRIATLLAAIVFMFLFLIPVAFVQGLSQLEQLQKMLPFLKGILKKTPVSQLITGYLPSVILMLFLYLVPPTMMFFSAIEGPISRSGRKTSACCKVLYFTIWNVFFVNVLSGSVISQVNTISSPKTIPMQLAKAVPRQATFFITYVLTSGWASLSSEVMQLFPLIYSLVRRHVFRCKSDDPDGVLSFPYHTEVPKLLLFGLLGLTCSILAPLIIPFLLVYFCLGFVVYRNQILNVYCSKYETGGKMWPIVHNTTVFSLVLAQIIALGVFGLKDSPIASGFTIPLVILTLLFNEYCRQRFAPVFDSLSAQDVIEMDRHDEENGRMEEIHEQLQSAYCQFPLRMASICDHEGDESSKNGGPGESSSPTALEITKSQPAAATAAAAANPTVRRFSISRLHRAVASLSTLIAIQNRNALR
ncbi:unnamed protein product [Spirodela intermedia]|uniref:Uncharacterized protein n=1 Tax=Spirodela intermedia TaxID=51605 RepID=A0A7I8KNR2_SPIIN|nr:unnamed protein product [Spirodela intermedia]